MQNGNGKEIALKVEQGITFDQMKERASLLRKSGFLPTALNTDEKVLTVMLTGQELGLGFMESLRSINVVNGKPCMSAQLLIGLCHRTGQVEQAYFEKDTEIECIYVLKRKGSPPYKSSFTMDDARKLGLSEKDNYKKQPRTMLGWRAISKAARVIFPDAVCGLYTPEEIADGVDLVEMPTGEVKVEEIHLKPVPAIESEAQAIKDDFTTEGASGLINPMEVDKLGAYYPRPPYDRTFPEKCIMEIFSITTPNGKSKGSLFLETIAKYSKDAEEKAFVQKFLELMGHSFAK